MHGQNVYAELKLKYEVKSNCLGAYFLKLIVYVCEREYCFCGYLLAILFATLIKVADFSFQCHLNSFKRNRKIDVVDITKIIPNFDIQNSAMLHRHRVVDLA